MCSLHPIHRGAGRPFRPEFTRPAPSRDADVAERLRRVDDHRLGYLREQFAPSFLAFCWAIAGDAIAADHPSGSRADVTRRAAALVFGEGGGA